MGQQYIHIIHQNDVTGYKILHVIGLRTHLWYVPTFTINKTNDFNSWLTPVSDNSFNYYNS